MIIDRPQSQYIFLFSRHSLNSSDTGSHMTYQCKRLTNKEYLEHWGKWIYLDERDHLDELVLKLDPYVEDGSIPCIKYDHTPQRFFDMDQCVLCVYCDDRQRDEVWEILSRFGIKGKAWVYEREVIEKWMPGGLLMEKWITAHGLTDKEAEEIREDARKKLGIIYERPSELCYGWRQ